MSPAPRGVLGTNRTFPSPPGRFAGSSMHDHSQAMTRVTNANRRYTLGLGAASAGTFTLSVNVGGNVLGPTVPIAFNANAAAIDAALETILPGSAGEALVTGSDLPAGLITIELTGELAGDQATITGDFAGLTGATPALTATQSATASIGGRGSDGNVGGRIGRRQGS